MRNLIIYLLLLFDLAVYGQTTQVTISRYAIPSAGETVTINEGYFPNLINITTNGVTTLAGNSYTMTYNSLPLIGSQWDVYLDVHHLTYNNANQITIFGRQPLVENPNTDTIYMHFTVLYDSTGSNAILDMKYVSQVVQLQTLFGNLTVNGNLVVDGSATVNGIGRFNDSVQYQGAPSVSGAPNRASILAVSATDSTIGKTCALLCTDSGEFWNVHGNTGLTNANFLGNIDTVGLNFRVNNQPSGRIDGILGNTFLGYQSGIANTTGNTSVAYGAGSLSRNTTGGFNSAIGVFAGLNNTTGQVNTSLGYESLDGVTTGSYNTGLGGGAGGTTTTGSYNTSLGYNANPASAVNSFTITIGATGVGTYINPSSNQCAINNVRLLSIPAMTSAVGYVLTDSSGNGDFKSLPPFGLTGTTYTPVTGDSVTISTGKNTVNPAGTIANWTAILPANPVSWQTYEFTFLQIVSTINWSIRLSGGTVSAGVPVAAAQYKSFAIYWNPTLSTWVLY